MFDVFTTSSCLCMTMSSLKEIINKFVKYSNGKRTAHSCFLYLVMGRDQIIKNLPHHIVVRGILGASVLVWSLMETKACKIIYASSIAVKLMENNIYASRNVYVQFNTTLSLIVYCKNCGLDFTASFLRLVLSFMDRVKTQRILPCQTLIHDNILAIKCKG